MLFNQRLNFDIKNVTVMSSMFSEAHYINQSLNSWDVNNVIKLTICLWMSNK